MLHYDVRAVAVNEEPREHSAIDRLRQLLEDGGLRVLDLRSAANRPQQKPVILIVDGKALDDEIDEIVVGDFHLRPMQNVLHLRERTIVLYKIEADILGALMSHSGEVVSFERLREILQRPHGTSRGSVAVHICMLRQKIEEAPGKPRHLVTVRGRGYCFRP